MKKIISIFLSAVIVLSLALPVTATNEEKVYDSYPLVVVRGIDFAGLYFEDGSPAISVSFRDILDLGKNYFRELLIEKNEDAFFDSAFDFAGKIFEPVSCDENGDSKYELFYDKYEKSMAEYSQEIELMEDIGETGLIKSAIDKIGAENVYLFTYDWRKSAKNLASDLALFIDNVLKESSTDKVNIAAVSMGGMVTSAYMYFHGAEHINNLTFLSSAHNGTYLFGDSICGNISFDGDMTYNLISNSVRNRIIVKFFVNILDKIGVFDAIASVGNKIVENNPQLLKNDTLRNDFATILGLWALCPDDAFERGTEFMFEGYEEQYPVLLERIDETKDFVFATEDILSDAVKDGVKLSFVSNYGYPLVPFFKHADMQSDGVLATAHTSNFATVAPYGETLTAEQVNAADEKYLSPDKSIDASTALYKDITWFVGNAQHVPTLYESEYSEFILWLVLSDRQLTVNDCDDYPQFMVIDTDERLVADK